MRICYVSTGKAWGGAESLLASLVEFVADDHHEVSLVVRQGSPLASWARERGLPRLLELPGRARSPGSLWRLRRWLIRSHCEVAVLNDPHAITCGGIAAIGLPIVRAGIRHTVFPIHSVWKHCRLLDQVICVSAAVQQTCLAAGIPGKKTSVIHGGVARPKLSQNNVQRVRELFAQSGDQNILSIGSLLPVKGFDTLIRAVARGAAAGRPWRLWIAGDGPLRDSLAALANESSVADRVHFLGFREDIGELLAESDLAVSASHSEGLSLVLLEAMLARCPIVATAVGGGRELLCVNDETQLADTFKPGDVVELTAAIERGLVSTPVSWARLDQAKCWAQQNFSLELMAEKHLALYSKLLAIDPPVRRAAA